jgi:hypothetical protein
MARAKSGGGITGKNVRHGRYGKSEPKPRAMSPAGVAQLGQHVGDHTTERARSSGYRGLDLERGRGYSTPIGPTDNVAAVGVGGGRTIYKSGTMGTHGPANPGQPMKPSKPLWEGWK